MTQEPTAGNFVDWSSSDIAIPLKVSADASMYCKEIILPKTRIKASTASVALPEGKGSIKMNRASSGISSKINSSTVSCQNSISIQPNSTTSRDSSPHRFKRKSKVDP